jgi:hypothetical protein
MANNFVSLGSMNMSQFMTPLTLPGLNSIEQASAALRRRGYRELTLKKDDRERLVADVRALKVDLIASDEVDPDTKRRILNNLNEVEATLVDSLIGGGEPIRRASDGLVGAIVGLPATEHAKPIVKRVAGLAASIAFTIFTSVGSQLAVDAVEASAAPPPPPSIQILQIISNGNEVPALNSGSYTIDLGSDIQDAEVIDPTDGN